MSFLIGADPELFVQDHGKLISSIGLIGGTKRAPRSIGNGCAVQEDNVAVEFNIPPCDSATTFINSINYALGTLEKEISKYKLEFAPVASGSFEDDQLQHPMALEFGCDPDLNAWTKKVNPKPNAANKNLRSCGGHVHIGFEGLDKFQVGRAMDLFVGVPATKLDKDTERRQLYGKAGCIRLKDYGIEYRTLSNFWIWDKSLMEWVYHQTSKAIDFVTKGNKLTAADGKIIQDCINNNNQQAYDYLVHKYQGA